MTYILNAAPSGNFDLSNWKLQLPVDSSGTFSASAREVKDLTNYEHSEYFYTGGDGAMVLAAPVEGATTSGSKYARSELREMNGAANAAWDLTRGGYMAATLEVDAVPTKLDGTLGRVVIGQVHGGDGQLVRVYWENGTVYYINGRTSTQDSDTKYALNNGSGQTPSISLDERFSYAIDVHGSNLKVSVIADGQTYTSTIDIPDAWNDNVFYFKAGTYLGENESTAKGWGQTSFYSLTFNHNGTSTPAPTPSPTPSHPTPTENQVSQRPVTTKTVNGSSANNTLKGSSGNDLLNGKAGNDVLWGYGGEDIMIGGSGKDAFAFNKRIGRDVDIIVDLDPIADTIRLENSIFTKLTKSGTLSSSYFRAGDKAVDTNDYLIYNSKSGTLYYDADGSGSKAAVHFATIENLAKLTASDIIVV
ncbi:polysaccharide lyase family 7 protein [Microvirga pakistanensis]|uniref:polysaccharide lyase family 7 protein n=1 Tax=Microvirga pakistanensis TaxID=1682650 RepID=UPI00106B5834|nr:polysaccharide lyase family 7 protein [Microvirga pakistanensis]